MTASRTGSGAKVSGDATLSEREQLLLKRLVERYIRDGQPVGSRTLSRDSGLELSPASIRNVMADLEDLGLITAPHTSAGRVPTVQGYRLFVDSLLTIEPLQSTELASFREQLSPKSDREHLLQSVSSLLSEVTQLAGVVSLPKGDTIRFRHIEFLPLADRRVLVIFVLNDAEVQNRVIETKRQYSPSELEQAANFLNQTYAGREIEELRQDIIDDLHSARDEMNVIMARAIEIAEQALEPAESDDVVVAGTTNLMEYGELADMDTLRQLFEAFSHKRDILHLLERCLNADGVKIFIGEESGYATFQDCSVVTAPYKANGRIVGVLGVVGPTRMAYERVIPIVDVTARLLGAALNQKH